MGTISNIARYMSESRASKWTGAGTANPEPWLLGINGASNTISGESVTYQSAMGLSAWFACVNVITQDAAKVPLTAYLRDGKGKSKAYGHPLYRLVHDYPNPEQTSYEFRRDMMGHLINRGNAYAQIIEGPDGWPRELWMLDPTRMENVRRIDGKIFYFYRDAQGKLITFSARNILHLRGLSNDGLVGMSVLDYARETIGDGLAVRKFGSAFFQNGATLGGILKHPKQLSDPAYKRLKNEFNDEHAGEASKAHKTRILEEGLEWQSVSVSPENAQWIESKKFTIPECCRFLRLKAHKVGDYSAASYSNIEQESLDHYGDTILPWHILIEQRINQTLIPPSEQAIIFVEHDSSALLRADFKTRMEGYSTALQNGFMNRDEVRAKENMNPLPDGDGELYTIQLNMQSIDEFGIEPEKPQEAADGVLDAPVVEDAVDPATALNGAQVTALLDIIAAVAEGRMPRQTGVALMAAAFPLDEKEADKIMGDVGKGFKLAPQGGEDNSRALDYIFQDAVERIERREAHFGDGLDKDKHRAFIINTLTPYSKTIEATTGQPFDIEAWADGRQDGKD